jgi:hypothetical protein
VSSCSVELRNHRQLLLDPLGGVVGLRYLLPFLVFLVLVFLLLLRLDYRVSDLHRLIFSLLLLS